MRRILGAYTALDVAGRDGKRGQGEAGEGCKTSQWRAESAFGQDMAFDLVPAKYPPFSKAFNQERVGRGPI